MDTKRHRNMQQIAIIQPLGKGLGRLYLHNIYTDKTTNIEAKLKNSLIGHGFRTHIQLNECRFDIVLK
jgi:hypothetical protein